MDPTPRTLHPRVRLVWLSSALVPWIVVLGGIFTLALMNEIDDPTGLAFVLAIPAAAFACGAAAWAWAAWRNWTWTAGAGALELRHGVIVTRTSFVPYHRVQQIDIVSGPIERMLGLSTLIVRTAAATSDAKIPGVATGDAEEARQMLLERVGADDAV